MNDLFLRMTRLLSALAILLFPAAAAAQVDPDLLAGLEARSIGPAGMSGRVAAVAAAPSDPTIIYVGAATGGVWKSVDAGLSFEPIFDDQPVAAIGALAIHPSDPDVLWVGTGEGNPRNSASVGDGVYRTRDGGASWDHLGLEATERITRILLDPSDPEVAYVSALGRAWGENPERGVFRTRDGGSTWEKVLYVDERTGAADLVMHPDNPRVLFAAMWDYRRWPWSFRSGGPGSGLFVTRDGGESWTRLTAEDGLPEGELGRIGLAIAPSSPDLMYAFVEAEENGIYRSTDGGRSWRSTGAKKDFGNRPFYYADLRVDPERPNRVYSLWSRISVSDDGGESWSELVSYRDIHPDHHAMWIDPKDGRHIIIGNDGGVAISRDRGGSWRFISNLPLAQYYHIRVDDELPYNVYGGMQDNGSWKGPSAVWENGEIRNHHWEEVGFGDGFDTSPFPDDPMQGYAMSQGGNLFRWNLVTGERKNIRPAPEGEDLRFNWNAGFAQDPFDAATIYYGSQFVHRSSDRGDRWEIISPDLTTDNPEWQRQAESGGLTPDVTNAENFTSIVAIAPSPVTAGIIWVGTDDGRLHVTRDGGATWTSIEESIPDVPANTWIPHIEPSPFAAGTAFVVFDNHRRSDWTPYVYQTTDFGQGWRRVAGEDDVRGYALSVTQDPVDPDLLFLGTEFGLHVSLDGGETWFKWTHGVPTVAVRDLVVQPREHDLVLGTHGRAAYVLDDISPLRGLTAERMDRPLLLFAIPDAIQHEVKQTGASRFPGDGEFRGRNRAYGAMISFAANQPDLPRPGEDDDAARSGGSRGWGEDRGGADEGPQIKLEFVDSDGEVVRSLERPAKLGLNRIFWDLRRDPFKRPQTGEPEEESPWRPSGIAVLPGTYTVRLSLGEHRAEGTLRVLPDPREEISRADREAKHEAMLRAGAVRDALAEGITRLYRTREDVDVVLGKARQALDDAGEEAGDGAGGKAEGETKSPLEELQEGGRTLKRTLTELEKTLWVPPDAKGIPYEEDKPWSMAGRALFGLASSNDAPTEAQLRLLASAENAVGEALVRLNRTFAEDVAAFRERVEASGLELLPALEPLELPR
ncbi:MAG: hypothetical protein JSV95_11195 [Gemmatimonadota bacterium]|nr:MAG: hypothetical protein JSV95_11195 [Gemmatimonadota bacterium]